MFEIELTTRSTVAPDLPRHLYIEVTNHCNSLCISCPLTYDHFLPIEPKEHLSWENFRRIVDPLPRLERVVLHGIGEPLLNRDLPRFIAHLKERGAYVLFNSNGVLLDQKRGDALVAAGLDELRVSIDAVTPDLYAKLRGLDALPKIIQNLHAFVARHGTAGKPKLSLWLVGMQENLHELLDFVRLGAEIGVPEVYLQRLVYFGDGQRPDTTSTMTPEQSLYGTLAEQQEQLILQAEALAAQMGVVFRASGATTPHESISTKGAHPWQGCLRPWLLMYVTANGMEPVVAVRNGRVTCLPWRAPSSVWGKVIAIAIAMPLVYGLGIALPYPLAFGLANPRATWVKAGEGSLPTLALQIAVYLLLTLLYGAALRLLPLLNVQTHWRQTHWRRQVGVIWLSWALCCAALLFASPNGESHDIYDYVFRGRMMDRFAASPLLTTPNAYPHAPFYRYVAWKKHVDTYGPFWEYASAATAKTVRTTLAWTGTFREQLPSCPQTAESCRMLTAYLTGYRLLAILLTGLSGLLIYRIVRATQPTLAPLALAIWLWNPLLLIATALGAHNDAIMLLLLLLCFWWWQRKRWLAGWLAFGLATQVKLTVLLLTPALGLWLVRKIGWRRAMGISLLAVGITLGLSWALYAPLGGWATLPRMLYERQLFVAHSLAQILYFLLYKWSGWPYSLVWPMMVGWSTLLFLPVAALLLLNPFFRANDPATSRRWTPHLQDLARTCTLLTLLYLLVGSFWLQPWYFVWVLAPAALWGDGRFPRQGLPWVCFGALCSNVIYDHLTQLPIAAVPEAHLYRVGVTVLVVMTIWLPLLFRQMGARSSIVKATR